jgi:hypothetical protein
MLKERYPGSRERRIPYPEEIKKYAVPYFFIRPQYLMKLPSRNELTGDII